MPQNPLVLELERKINLLEDRLAACEKEKKTLFPIQVRFHQLMNDSPVVMFTFEPRGTYPTTSMSPNITRQLGYSPQDFLEDPDFWINRVHPEDKPALLTALSRFFTDAFKKNAYTYEYRFRHQNGGYRWMLAKFCLMRDAQGNPLEGVGYWLDTTECRQIEERLRESKERYRNVVDNIAIGVALISPDMEILTLNKQMRQWFPHIDVSERPICYRSYNIPPRDQPCSYCPTIHTLRDGNTHESVSETPIKGEIVRYRIISSPIRDDAGNVVAAIEMVEDITERIRTEAHIQQLSRQLLKAQEEERQMISRELHDSVAQDLSALKIGLAMLCPETWPDPEARRKLVDLADMLDHSISTVRDLSYNLRPPGLKEFGLIQAVRIFCEQFLKTTGICVDFCPAGLKPTMFDGFIDINLYRLIQEGLNNVRKHAHADRVTVKLIGAGPEIILRIEDNGRGFDAEAREHHAENEKRMGLGSMKERVRLMGGVMTIDSRPMKGTKIMIKLPISGGVGK